MIAFIVQAPSNKLKPQLSSTPNILVVLLLCLLLLQLALEDADPLVDCPCCVPITYKIRPDDSSCLWPPTPAPSSGPTTLAELLANGGSNPGRGGVGALVMSTVGAMASLMAAAAVGALVADAKR